MASASFFAKILIPTSVLIAATGCAQSFKAQVNRFQAMPAPQGQSFFITSVDPKRADGLEFSQYAGLVSQKLQALGYQAAGNADTANLRVTLDYGVDGGKERIRTVPGSSFGGGFGHFDRWGRFYGAGWSPWYSGFSGYGRRGFIYGWHDAFLHGNRYDEIESYTVYASSVTMNIAGTATGQRVFEGSAKAVSRDDNLTHLVPNLIEAMFTGFPGSSGETIKITIAPPDKN